MSSSQNPRDGDRSRDRLVRARPRRIDPSGLPARIAVLVPLCLLAAAVDAAGVRVTFEGGGAWQTRNDFRIPGSGGTLVDLQSEASGPFTALRATAEWDVGNRQSLRFLAAPLRVETTIVADEALRFQDVVFESGRPLEATYVFNSYRLTWSWRFPPGRKWSFRLGATLKVRDAEIGLSDPRRRSVKTDLGFVPLLYAHARYQATERLALEIEVDALAAPQGRAEDVSLKGVYRLSDRLEVDLGYRLLEGGADNDEVYTFAFFHYAVAGVRLRF